MEKFKVYLKKKHNLSNYQIAQIIFLFKTFISEISKIILMGILFYKQLPVYFFALFILLFLRSTTGGLHFYTYTSCLLTSALYMIFSIKILPLIQPPKYMQLLGILLSILICNYVGPMLSKYRPRECEYHFKELTRFISIILFVYALVLYIIPENQYVITGFWVIILHSLQLLIAKIKTKGEKT